MGVENGKIKCVEKEKNPATNKKNRRLEPGLNILGNVF
ncbi:hypothetical protein BH23BAC3_BH23BAC3_33360 [soil metagenome]